MAALHNLYDFLDEFNEIFGEKAEYEIKSMLDNTITVKMIYKRRCHRPSFSLTFQIHSTISQWKVLIPLMCMTDMRRLRLRLNAPAMERLTFQLKLATRHFRKFW